MGLLVAIRPVKNEVAAAIGRRDVAVAVAVANNGAHACNHGETPVAVGQPMLTGSMLTRPFRVRLEGACEAIRAPPVSLSAAADAPPATSLRSCAAGCTASARRLRKPTHARRREFLD